MNTQTEEFSVSLSIFQEEIQLGLRVMKFLLVLSMLLGAVSTAQAQALPQQYVYGSQPTTPTSSVISGFSKANQTGALSTVPGSPLNERFEGGLVAIDGRGKFVFVLNPIRNDISMFQIEQSSGALSEVPASPFAVAPTLNPSHAPTMPISITTEKSGGFVFVGYYDGDIVGSSSVVSLAIDTSGSSPILVTKQSTVLFRWRHTYSIADRSQESSLVRRHESGSKRPRSGRSRGIFHRSFDGHIEFRRDGRYFRWARTFQRHGPSGAVFLCWMGSKYWFHRQLHDLPGGWHCEAPFVHCESGSQSR